MSAVFLSPGRQWEEHHLHHRFHYVDEPGRGFAFPCDAQGSLLPGLSAAALTNYDTCLSLAEAARMVDEGLVDEVQHHYEPPVIACLRCQNEVTLSDAWLSTCSHCGADYNGSGQLLAPRHLWGEEASEHPADLLSI
jgi:hypothetical protein